MSISKVITIGTVSIEWEVGDYYENTEPLQGKGYLIRHEDRGKVVEISKPASLPSICKRTERVWTWENRGQESQNYVQYRQKVFCSIIRVGLFLLIKNHLLLGVSNSLGRCVAILSEAIFMWDALKDLGHTQMGWPYCSRVWKYSKSCLSQ